MSYACIAEYPPRCVLDAAEAGVSGAFHGMVESLVVVFVVAGVAALYYTRGGGLEYFDSFMATYGLGSLAARLLIVWASTVLFLYTGFLAMAASTGALHLALYAGPGWEHVEIWLPLAASAALSSLLVVVAAGAWSYASKAPLGVLVGLAVVLLTARGSLVYLGFVDCVSSLRFGMGQRGLLALALAVAGTLLFLAAWRRR